MYRVLTEILIILTTLLKTIFKSRNDLIIENLALRQQLSTYKAKKIKPIIKERDRSFWIALKNSWSTWADTLIIVKPETVIHWQKRLFKRHWTKISSKNKRCGRTITKKEIKDLIYQMARENNWGAPRIYSELLMLGYTKNEISQSTVSRYLKRYTSRNPDHKRPPLTFEPGMVSACMGSVKVRMIVVSWGTSGVPSGGTMVTDGAMPSSPALFWT